jgi:hypothetical protein
LERKGKLLEVIIFLFVKNVNRKGFQGKKVQCGREKRQS